MMEYNCVLEADNIKTLVIDAWIVQPPFPPPDSSSRPLICMDCSLTLNPTRVRSVTCMVRWKGCIVSFRELIIWVLAPLPLRIVFVPKLRKANPREARDSLRSKSMALKRTGRMALSIGSAVKLRDGTMMPLFGLGVYDAAANGETEQAVLWALKHGYRHIDTAAAYK